MPRRGCTKRSLCFYTLVVLRRLTKSPPVTLTHFASAPRACKCVCTLHGVYYDEVAAVAVAEERWCALIARSVVLAARRRQRFIFIRRFLLHRPPAGAIDFPFYLYATSMVLFHMVKFPAGKSSAHASSQLDRNTSHPFGKVRYADNFTI